MTHPRAKDLCTLWLLILSAMAGIRSVTPVQGQELAIEPNLSSSPNSNPTLSQIDRSPRFRLDGNIRPEATPEHDLGPVEDSFPIEHVFLQLRRSGARQEALDLYAREVNEKGSPNYHRWLTPQQFGLRFGVDAQNLGLVTSWLEMYGLRVNSVYPNRLVLDFSGTAGQIREAFQTQIHAYEVNGLRHFANSSNPSIPSALVHTVEGIVSLHDFQLQARTRPKPQFTIGSGISSSYSVTPADLATIYNLTPVFKAGYTGTGQIIALVEDSDVYSATDWTTFRSSFGLSGYTSGNLKTVHPVAAKGGTPCADPGVQTGWDDESILDAEYASASAPNATIEVASCATSGATNGHMIALVNTINAATASLPTIISVSFGACEAGNGATANAAISAAYQQAVVEGISVFAAAGDGGAAFCDEGSPAATHGIGVNAYASTAYNVAVGGTDFSDTYSKTNPVYWSTTNSSTDGSAKSYIPEIPWNDTCANPFLALWSGYSFTYGASGFCYADYQGLAEYQDTVAGGGGPSGCASGSPSTAYVVSGTCRGWAKPTWQSATGIPKDNVRDLPDVSLFAGDGLWNHAYVYCNSNLSDLNGATCKGVSPAYWSQAGGTSFAAPIMAGIQALINQKWGKQGNPNPIYYKLAAAQYVAAATKTACYAGNGAASGATCIFHDITQGASTVNCQGSTSCLRASRIE